MNMTTSPASGRPGILTADPRHPSPRASWRQVPNDLAYLLLGFPIALAAFVAAVTGVSVGVSLLIIWVGVPILVLTLTICRGFAALERARIQACEGRPVPESYYAPVSGGPVRRSLGVLREPQYWRDVVHAFVAFPVKIFTWCVTVTWLAAGVGGVTYITYGWAIERVPDNESLPELIWGIESPAFNVLMYVVIGLFFLATLPYVARGLASLDVGLGRILLTNPGAAENAALRARTEQLQESRAAAAQAEATTLRRVERDIHDGPQQRLVRLTMDLEAAQRRMDDDPEAARPLVEEALTQTQEALAELRALSRGIAPPILADRGLEAALAAAAGRCPVPVHLEVSLGPDRRLPAATENVAYFTVAEALTNVAKHSGASSVTVSVARVADVLHLLIDDDGVGGAHIGKGHGLAGLADRIAGVDGTLDVHSPPGGGTVVTAQVPIVSE
jgi:signal transduction histidine kinase